VVWPKLCVAVCAVTGGVGEVRRSPTFRQQGAPRHVASAQGRPSAKGAEMKKKTLGAGLAAVAAVVLVPVTLFQVTAGATGKVHQQDQPGAITIQSWLYAVPSENVLSGTVWDCFEITGAITDQGGGPTWTDETSYHAPNTTTSGGMWSSPCPRWRRSASWTGSFPKRWQGCVPTAWSPRCASCPSPPSASATP